jgi:8-oxo-dGTP diphosphatase
MSTYIVNVEGAIWHAGRYLVIVRGEAEEHAAGTLSWVGGKVEETEEAADVLENTLKREILEEVGVQVQDIHYVSNTHFGTGVTCIDIVFLCRYASGEPTPQSPDEVAEILWLTADEIRVHPKTPVWIQASLERVEAARARLNWM